VAEIWEWFLGIVIVPEFARRSSIESVNQGYFLMDVMTATVNLARKFLRTGNLATY
jgi:hypothetical protein